MSGFLQRNKRLRPDRKKQRRRKTGSIQCDVITLEGGCTAAGWEGAFFSLSPSSKFGIKVYSEWRHAQAAYLAQKAAARKGLAPKVGKMLIVNHKKTGSKDALYFGYETQKAKPVPKVRGSEWNSPVWTRQYSDFERKLLDHDIIAGDFSPQNCGIINGRLVWLDFGPISLGD